MIEDLPPVEPGILSEKLSPFSLSKLTECSALDLIYDTLDDLVLNGEMSTVDLFLRSVEVDKYDIDHLLGFLTVTLHAHDYLPSRLDFFNRVKRCYWDDPDRERLFAGLDSYKPCPYLPRLFEVDESKIR